MKDRLIELIKKGGVIIPETAEAVADYLIANNVFVLPEQMKDSWELALPFMMRLFVADEAEIEKIKGEFELQKVNQILTDIRNYLVAILDEWHRRIDEPNFYEQNIQVYNHIRKELDDLIEYAEKLGVEL
ncbi:MAG: hypothetical protein J6J71_04800 [Prevotella sp.]|nr:hypothetical protein [Prevotella sp.]